MKYISSGRQPFTWYMNGNMNLNIILAPNRLSLHPTYKGVTGHIGDVAMSFSPYILNGI